tara:strand:- start:462 stop:668 length:207 start_codon:yes stop_codon:yes gene_type:complete
MKMIHFEKAVYLYACHLSDNYGQGIGGSEYPDEKESYFDYLTRTWHLRGYKGSRLAAVSENEKVKVGY